MALAFHPTDCAQYKVVCIRACALGPCGELYQIQIYSSLLEKWKISIESFSARESDFRQGVYWNGAVYWAPFDRDLSYFKIDDEKLHTLPLPEGLIPSTMYLGESRGHLHLILHTTLHKNSRCLNVYELLCDHSGWFVKYELQLDELLGVFPFLFSLLSCNEFKVIDVVRGDKEEDTFAVMKVRGKIITYNVHDKSFKHIFTLPSNFSESNFEYSGGFYGASSCFHRYTETLTSF